MDTYLSAYSYIFSRWQRIVKLKASNEQWWCLRHIQNIHASEWFRPYRMHVSIVSFNLDFNRIVEHVVSNSLVLLCTIYNENLVVLMRTWCCSRWAVANQSFSPWGKWFEFHQEQHKTGIINYACLLSCTTLYNVAQR